MKRDYERERFESELAAEGVDARIIRITCDRKHKTYWAHLMWEISPGRWDERLTVAQEDAAEAVRIAAQWGHGLNFEDSTHAKRDGKSEFEHLKRQPALDNRPYLLEDGETWRGVEIRTFPCPYERCSNNLQSSSGLTRGVVERVLTKLADNGVQQITIDGLREACERHMRNTR